MKLEIIMLMGKDGFFELVEDNGNGSSEDEISFARTPIRYEQSTGQLVISSTSGALVEAREWSIKALAFSGGSEPTATLGGHSLTLRAERVESTVTVHLGKASSNEGIVVSFGADPTLARNPAADIIKRVLEDAQISFATKLDILYIQPSLPAAAFRV